MCVIKRPPASFVGGIPAAPSTSGTRCCRQASARLGAEAHPAAASLHSARHAAGGRGRWCSGTIDRRSWPSCICEFVVMRIGEVCRA